MCSSEDGVLHGLTCFMTCSKNKVSVSNRSNVDFVSPTSKRVKFVTKFRITTDDAV